MSNFNHSLNKYAYAFGCLLIAMALVAIPSCDKFLNKAKPTDRIDAPFAFQSVNNISSYFDGIYSLLKTYGGQDDATGFQWTLNYTNLRGEDIRQDATWGNTLYTYTAVHPSSRVNLHIWGLCYAIIEQCNVVLHNLEESNLDITEINAFRAEAQALRAFMHFELLQFYAQPYLKDNGNALGVPVSLVPTTIDSKGVARTTVRNVYEVILQDLNEAISLFPRNHTRRDRKDGIRLEVALGIRARVKLHMGNYSGAAQDAELAVAVYWPGGLNQYVPNPNDYLSGFTNINSVAWMWGIPFSAQQNNGFAAFTSTLDATIENGSLARYFPVKISPNLYGAYRSSDIRRLALLDYRQILGSVLEIGMRKFRALPDFSEDNVLMRVEEMMLIASESHARNNNEERAKEILFKLQQARDPSLSISNALSGQQLINTILLERRKELLGEGLADFADKKRLGMAWERTQIHGEYQFCFEPFDPCMLFPIPESELQSNLNISSGDQNPACELRSCQQNN